MAERPRVGVTGNARRWAPGWWCTRLALRLAGRRRHIAAVNLRLCFPGQSEDERQRLLKAHFDALGKGVIETALAWWGRSAPLQDRVRVVGLQHLQQARAKGRGVILLSAHFTTLELGGRLLAQRWFSRKVLLERWFLHRHAAPLGAE